ncbi:MAG: urease accessory protein UreF [Aestuariivirga sp.]|nr:urease accessory protein UreF [Aestuariivirga sp.]
MAITTEPQQLLRLLAFMSPAFPVGGFAYSHGLERAIDDGTVRSADAVREWIESLLVHGSGWNDAVLFARAYDADAAARLEIDELALGLAASRERALETSDLGRSFSMAVATMSVTEDMNFQTYPIAVAAACQKACIDKYAGLLAYLQAFSNNLIAVAVRLIPLGQTKGLEVMRDLMPVIFTTSERASAASLDDLGSSTLLLDIASMQHETQYSRVFRS